MNKLSTKVSTVVIVILVSCTMISCAGEDISDVRSDKSSTDISKDKQPKSPSAKKESSEVTESDAKLFRNSPASFSFLETNSKDACTKCEDKKHRLWNHGKCTGLTKTALKECLVKECAIIQKQVEDSGFPEECPASNGTCNALFDDREGTCESSGELVFDSDNSPVPVEGVNCAITHGKNGSFDVGSGKICSYTCNLVTSTDPEPDDDPESEPDPEPITESDMIFE